MREMNRRDFLKAGLGVAAGTTLGMTPLGVRRLGAQSPNETIRVAVAGVNGYGRGMVGKFQGIAGVEVVALVDPDSQVLERELGRLKTGRNGGAPAGDVQGYADVRHALERDDIDVLCVATPNHWHSLMTIWGCQAGKHVWVEKPVSHSIWEGRQMVHAARKYNRLVQAGTQQRSCPAVRACAVDIQAGRWGKVKWVHCSRLGARQSIGKVTQPLEIPDSVDYNLWAGPMPAEPVMRGRLHYDWHWQWTCGDGEMGNWGAHYLDDLRHVVGWTDVPKSVVAAGGRFAWDDNGQTPNMIMAFMEHDDFNVVVDIRNLPDPARAGGEGGAIFRGVRWGNTFMCEHARVHLERGKGQVFDHEGKLIHEYPGDSGRQHVQNFVDALRSGRREDLNAEVEVGHHAAAMAHMANASYRMGQTAGEEQVREAMAVDEQAVATLEDMLEQLKGNGVELAKTPLTLGPRLTFDRAVERFTGEHAEAANGYVKLDYREGFEVPEEV